MSLAVVQAVSNAYKFDGSTTSVKFTWGAQPSSGNLLIMSIGSWSSTQPSFTGWTQFSINTTGGWWLSVYYRYAGASEPTTVTDSTTHIAWDVNAWEISGVTGTIGVDLIKVSLATGGGGTQSGPTSSTITPSAITTQTNTTLALAAFNSYSQTASTTFTMGGSFSLDSQFCTATADGSNALFDYGVGGHRSVTGGTSVQPTLTPNHSTFWAYNLIELGHSGSTETATVDMALSGVAFNAPANRTETGSASLALKGVAFSGAAIRHATINVTMALNGVAIAATGLDQGVSGSGSVHFATFGA